MSAGTVELREPIESDFEIIFAMRQDPVGNAMSKVYPLSRDKFEVRWNRTPVSPHEVARIILFDGVVVGKIASFVAEDAVCVGYMIAQDHWGKGIATQALRMFVDLLEHRPLIAHAAKSNIGSCRVLEKCGFVKVDERDSPETERYMACVEVIYELR